MNFDKVITREERALFKLRQLYSDFGYSQYRMSKFEEYDLYVKNKDFLVSDNVITFTDTDGRLLALKPDVTLSIIKNSKDADSGVMKVYYNENVYRVSKGTHTFREIMQAGVECVGDIGVTEEREVVTLAAKSLESVSDSYVLEISSLDIVSGMLDFLGISEGARRTVLECLGEKNVHGAMKMAEAEGVTEEGIALIKELISLHGSPETVIPVLSKFALNDMIRDAIEELSAVVASLGDNRIRIDFSVVNNTSYYNGIAIRGFVSGIPTPVLLGGRYDRLMKRMKRRSRAIGFAVYLDELSRLGD